MAKKIAIVTGASSGLGKEFLKALLPDSAEFDEIWIIARRLEKLTEAAAECGVSSGKVKPISMDLTEKTAYDELDNMLRDADVDVRVLINNAGCGVLGNVADMPVDGQIRMTDLNVPRTYGSCNNRCKVYAFRKLYYQYVLDRFFRTKSENDGIQFHKSVCS